MLYYSFPTPPPRSHSLHLSRLSILHTNASYLPVFGLNEISEGLGFHVVVVSIRVGLMVVVVLIYCWSYIFHLEDISALWAALDGAVAGHLGYG
jgi:hypothetical protein